MNDKINAVIALLFCVLFISGVTSSQNNNIPKTIIHERQNIHLDGKVTIIGKVLAIYLDSIPGAKIKISSPFIDNTLSDESGSFTFVKRNPGTYIMSISRIGYTTYIDTISIPSDQIIVLDFEIASEPIEGIYEYLPNQKRN
jgi:hypothetical protein